MATLEEIMRGGYSVSVFTSWQWDVAEQVWIRSAVASKVQSSPRESFFGALAANET
jgi:hypothetical protein